MKFNRYVFETLENEKRFLVNVVTHQWLPEDSPEEEFHSGFFLEGQEQQAIHSKLSQVYKYLDFNVVSTWRCNLRCTHCSVGHLLNEKTDRINPQSICNFVKRFHEERGMEYLQVLFLGGEPLLAIDDSNAVLIGLQNYARLVNVNSYFSVVTNLTIPLTEKHLSFLSQLDTIAVSIDGPESAHNQQRVPYKGDFNPFQKTIDNVKVLVKNGFANKIKVQACLADEYNNHATVREFYRVLLKLGVHRERMFVGSPCPHITDQRVTEAYMESLKKPMYMATVCCKYRFNKYVTDYTNVVYSDFNSWCPLGKITDSLDVLEEARWKLIRDMPAMNDDVCLKCPCIGYCWGHCTHTEFLGRKPSTLCDQKRFIEELNKAAQDGNLRKQSVWY